MPVGAVKPFQTCFTLPVRASSLYTRPACGASAPRVLIQTFPLTTETPVGTGSQPLVPGLAFASGPSQALTSLTVGGAKKVEILPVLGFTLRTSLAPPSATNSPNRDHVIENGLESASTG